MVGLVRGGELFGSLGLAGVSFDVNCLVWQ